MLKKVVNNNFGPIYRQKRGNQLVGPQDFHGWAADENNLRYAVFRSRKNREVWITSEEFRQEYQELKQSAKDKYFTTRKGFQIAEPKVGTCAWYQGIGRRFLRVFNENLQPVPYKHEMA